jgi:hypothetical protein
MFWTLFANMVLPNYFQLSNSKDFYWGLSWFAVVWTSYGSWSVPIQYAFSDFDSFLFDALGTVIPVALAVLLWFGHRSRSIKYARGCLVLSTTLLAISLYSWYLDLPSLGPLITTPKVLTTMSLFTVFAYQSQTGKEKQTRRQQRQRSKHSAAWVASGPEKKLCSKCDTSLPVNARFCDHCGAAQ